MTACYRGSREPTDDRRRQPEQAHSRCAIAQPRPRATSRQGVAARSHAGVRCFRLCLRADRRKQALEIAASAPFIDRPRSISYAERDVTRRCHQSRNCVPAEIRSPLSGNGGGNFLSRKPLKTREMRKFSQRSATISRGRNDGPSGPGRSRRGVAAEIAGTRSRRKFSSPQSLEKSENAEIFAVIAERPVFRTSTGPPRSATAYSSYCVTPEPIRPVARKWRRNSLKRLDPRPEMVWSRKHRSHKIWYTGARLTVRSS